jgi:tetratricopeptide (TPR) repeat protein
LPLGFGDIFLERKEFHQTMTVKEKILTSDMKEPLMVEWVLDRIENISATETQTIDEITEQLFNDTTISYIIDHFGENLLTRMFRVLPHQCFSHQIPLLIDKWPTWQDEVASWAAPVIARCDPDKGAELFRNYLQNGDAIFSDLNKWHGVMRGLTHLPFDTARRLSDEAVKAYVDNKIDAGVKFLYSLYIVALAWTYDHSEFPSVFRGHIRPMPSKTYGQYLERMRRLVAMFEFSTMEFDLLSDMIEKDNEVLSEILSRYYRNDIPHDRFRDAVMKIKKRSFEFVPSFLKEYAHVIENQRLRQFFQDLVDDDAFIAELHRKKQRPYLYAMILACMMTSIKKQKMALAGTPVAEVVELLSWNIETIPDMNGFIDYFRGIDRDDAVRHLTAALETSRHHFGGSHIVQVMTALGYDKFIDPLVQVVSSRDATEFCYMIAVSALSGYGEKVVDYFTDHFDRLTQIGKLSALPVVQQVGGPKAIDFVDQHFDQYWKADREGLLLAFEALGSDTFRERLKTKTNKGQVSVDRAFIVLSLLEDGKTAEVETLLKSYYAKRAEQDRISQALKTGHMLGTITPYIDVELHCKNCGDESAYRLHQVFISDKSKGRPYIAQEIRCVNCNIISEFEFTSKGLMVLTGEMTRLMMFASDEEKREAVKRSPLKIIASSLHGKAMDIHDAIEAFRTAIQTNPDNPENYINLGNIYANTYQFNKADENFRGAIEKDPAYLQAYYGLAKMAGDAGKAEAALSHLERAIPYITAPKFPKGFEANIPNFISSFCEIHNDLVTSTKANYPMIRPSDFKVTLKIGRNAPCPCGSGKKYKKCCMV